MRTFVLTLTVDFGDCDPAGIVFYPNFYRWFDRATHQMFGAVGYDFFGIKRDLGLIAWPLVDTGAKFLLPASVGDRIEMHSTITNWSAKTFRIAHQARREGQLLVDGFEVRILGEPQADDPKRLRAALIPDEMKRRFD
jgi:4-hydroxybenzoyl-CoA thioesterase